MLKLLKDFCLVCPGFHKVSRQPTASTFGFSLARKVVYLFGDAQKLLGWQVGGQIHVYTLHPRKLG